MAKIKFDEIGCRKCGKGGSWSVFTDGKGNFKALCPYGHVSNFGIIKQPDLKSGVVITQKFSPEERKKMGVIAGKAIDVINEATTLPEKVLVLKIMVEQFERLTGLKI